MPFTDMGWMKLSVRGRRAADRFGIGYDGFRRGTIVRPSRMDDVVRRVAVSLTDLLRTDPDPVDTPRVTENVGHPRRGAGATDPALARDRVKRLVRIALVLGVVVAGAVVLRRDDQGAPAATRALRCSGAVGALDVVLSREPTADRISARLQSVFDHAGGDVTAGCPTGPAYRWQKLVVQEMSQHGLPNGALVTSPNDVDVYLNRAAWGSYHQLGGKDGGVAQAMGGLIIEVIDFEDGHAEIELSTGTVLVAERSDAPYFWVPAPFVEWWRKHPELGLPTSNPLASARQEFQHGVGTVAPGRVGDPVVSLVDHPRDELPTLESIRGRILRQADATAWFVDDEGRRLWIPDGGTWDCLGSAARQIGGNLPGYAISTLPFGGQARCPA